MGADRQVTAFLSTLGLNILVSLIGVWKDEEGGELESRRIEFCRKRCILDFMGFI